MRPFLFAALLWFPIETYAVPGPLMSGGVGLISVAWALFALSAGAAALFFKGAAARFSAWYRKRPGVAWAVLAAIFSPVLAAAAWFWFFRTVPDDAERLLEAVRSNRNSTLRSEDFAGLSSVMEFSSGAKTVRDAAYPELEKEIAYSIGKNRSVVWSRYLSEGKIRIDESLLAEIRRGAHVLSLSELLADAKSANPKYRVIDLRTEEEFDTSARFRGASNLEYRKIVNGEIPFDPNAAYVTVCHDGNLDLSRSVIAAIHLRQRGIPAFALDTGMSPLIEAFGMSPLALDKKPAFSVWKTGETFPDGTLVDPLGAVRTLEGVPSRLKAEDFPFYRMDSATYAASVARMESALRSGGRVRFACYDGFSCFYSRVFVDRLTKRVPENPPSILIFR